MKSKFFLGLVVVAAVAGLIFAYSKMSGERAQEKERESAITAESKISQPTNGEPVLTLSEEMQNRIALKVEPLVATNFVQELKGYGRILDPTRLIEQVAELNSARLAAEVSRKEYERLKTLSENTSARALQTAEANARRDELAVRAAETKIKLDWGSAIADRENLSELLKALVNSEKSLVQIGLPIGAELSANPPSARLICLGKSEMVEAEFLGASPKIDEQTQREGLFFLTKTKAAGFLPGAAVTGYIKIPGEPLRGVIVPRSAVVRHEGKAWVYLKTAADSFSRHEIDLKIPTDDGWLIRNLPAENQIVTSGAETLLSEESKSQLRLGD